MDRTEKVIMSRIKIGHTKLNNTLKIIRKLPTGQCSCGERETVERDSSITQIWKGEGKNEDRAAEVRNKRM